MIKMKMKNLLAILVLLVLIGCTASEVPEQPETAAETTGTPEEAEAGEAGGEEAPGEETAEEEAEPSAPVDLEVKLLRDGFETESVEISSGSSCTGAWERAHEVMLKRKRKKKK